MLRNEFGSLAPIESVIVIVEQFVLGALVLRMPWREKSNRSTIR